MPVLQLNCGAGACMHMQHTGARSSRIMKRGMPATPQARALVG